MWLFFHFTFGCSSVLSTAHTLSEYRMGVPWGRGWQRPVGEKCHDAKLLEIPNSRLTNGVMIYLLKLEHTQYVLNPVRSCLHNKSFKFRPSLIRNEMTTTTEVNVHVEFPPRHHLPCSIWCPAFPYILLYPFNSPAPSKQISILYVFLYFGFYSICNPLDL